MWFLILFSTSVFASIPTPVWSLYQSNNSYLNNTQVQQNDFNTKILGGLKHTEELKQQYQDQTRNLQSNGDISTSMQQMNQLQSINQNFQNSALDSARKVESQPYISNVQTANRNGYISQPIQYTAGAAAMVTGNAMETNIGPTKVTTFVNLTNQTNWVKVDTSYLGIKLSTTVNVTPTSQTNTTTIQSIAGNLTATLNPNAPTDPLQAQAVNQEAYQVNYSRAVPLTGCSLGASYTGSTQVYRISLSRPIYRQITGQIDDNLGNPGISIYPEIVYKIGYGVKF